VGGYTVRRSPTGLREWGVGAIEAAPSPEASSGVGRVRRRHGTEDRELPHGVTRMVAPTWTAGTGAWLHYAGSATRGFVKSCLLQSLFQANNMKRQDASKGWGVLVASRSRPDPKRDRNSSPGGNQLGDPGYATPLPGAVPRRTQTPHPNRPARCGVDRPTPHPRDNSAIVRPRIPSCVAKERARPGEARHRPRDNSAIVRPRVPSCVAEAPPATRSTHDTPTQHMGTRDTTTPMYCDHELVRPHHKVVARGNPV